MAEVQPELQAERAKSGSTIDTSGRPAAARPPGPNAGSTSSCGEPVNWATSSSRTSMHGSWRNWPGDSGGDSPGGTLSRARRANGAWAIGPVDAPRLWVELGSYPTVFWLLAASLVIAPRPCWRPARSRPARYEFVIERENRLRLEGKVATASGNRRARPRARADLVRSPLRSRSSQANSRRGLPG